MDGCPRPTIANMHKHFPGATLRQSEAQKEGRGYNSATGEAFPNEGEFTVPARTQEGHRRDLVFQHPSRVSIPILSTGGLADCGNDTTYSKKGGYIKHLATGQVSKFIRMHGVYFIKMKIPHFILCADANGKERSQVFARQGP